MAQRKKALEHKTKQVHLKPHHAKSYRKRHIALVTLSIVGIIVIASLLLWYREAVVAGVASSREFVASLFTPGATEAKPLTITSSHGVSVSVDQQRFYASAVDANSGQLYVGDELGKEAAYTSVRLATIPSADVSGDIAQPTFTLTIHPAYAGVKTNLAAVALADAGVTTTTLSRGEVSNSTYGGSEFSRTVWHSENAVGGVQVSFSTYTAIVDGSLVTITVAHGLNATGEDTTFLDVLSSLRFNKEAAALTSTGTVSAAATLKQPDVLTALDFLTNTQKAAAATQTPTVGASEKVGALYSPAVVKIYNAYCMDIEVKGAAFLKNVCSAASGSGFIVSADGYIGTNGHVATANPKDLAIYNAFYFYVFQNQPTAFTYLFNMTGLTEADIAGKTTEEKLALYIDKMYALDDSQFVAKNAVQNLLVNISDTAPDMEKLVKDTKAAKEYPSDANVVRAKVIDSNYRQAELITGTFTASDVALLKLETGDAYPTVKLGGITDVTQGASLSILGYPGQTSDNGIVASSTNTPTLTNGKVSSIKNAGTSDQKLIETDTTIGHGNSGGPAMNDEGLVVGVATYTVDGSGKGNGTYNYIRDIGDFEALLAKHNVTPATSTTQSTWETGVDKFYNAHYSSAMKYFNKVKELYPNHSKVNEFIASAEKHIANGDDVSEFPFWVVWTGLGVLLVAGAGVGVFFIIRHTKRHKAYAAGVAQGAVQPAAVAAGTPTPVLVTPVAPVVQPVVQAPIPAAPVNPVVVAPPVPLPPAPVQQSNAPLPQQPIDTPPVATVPQPQPQPQPQVQVPAMPGAPPTPPRAPAYPPQAAQAPAITPAATTPSADPQTFNPFNTPINNQPQPGEQTPLQGPPRF